MENTKNTRSYTTAAIVAMLLAALRRILTAVSHTAAGQSGAAADAGILLVWLVFPLVAFAAAQWHALRCRIEKKEPGSMDPPSPAPPCTFATYAYYPERKGSKDKAAPELPKDTFARDRLVTAIAVALAAVGLYLPLIGTLPGVAALLLVRWVHGKDQKGYFQAQGRRAQALGWCTVIQLVLYLMVTVYLL